MIKSNFDIGLGHSDFQKCYSPFLKRENTYNVINPSDFWVDQFHSLSIFSKHNQSIVFMRRLLKTLEGITRIMVWLELFQSGWRPDRIQIKKIGQRPGRRRWQIFHNRIRSDLAVSVKYTYGSKWCRVIYHTPEMGPRDAQPRKFVPLSRSDQNIQNYSRVKTTF